MKDEPHTVCPECKGSVIRLIGAGAGIVFKGSGFYVTDYRKENQKQSNEGSEKKVQEGKSQEGKSPKEAKTPKKEVSSSTAASAKGNSS